jgi:hypothetical protein
MSTRVMPAHAQGRPAKLVPSAESIRSAKSPTGEIAKPSRLQMSKPQPGHSGTGFDPKTFLAKAGLGRTIVRLKKGEVAYAQATPPTRFFMCRRAD